MIATIISLNVIGFMFLYVLVFRTIKKTSYYRNLRELYIQARRAPARITSKSDIRRLRKARPYVKVFRKKITSLMLLNVAIFMTIYTAMIFSTMYLVLVYFDGVQVIPSPIMIPFFTIVDLQSGRIYLNTYSVVFIAFITALYPVTREMRLQ